jgi:fluoride ion exporter CrcB/FEX
MESGNGEKNYRPDIRLLLHTEDGAVPFLTPALLRQAFSAASVADVLMFGLAVRDTSVVPVYPEAAAAATTNAVSTRKAKKSRIKDGKANDAAEQGAAVTAPTTVTATPPKPRGYTFTGSVLCDRWLIPYQRVTVPTFDPFADGNSNPTTPSLLSSTTHPMALWTSNGRQCISVAQFCACAKGLSSQTCVPLFEPIPKTLDKGSDVSNNDNDKRTKRKLAIVRTNKAWTEQVVATATQVVDVRIWAPMAVDPNGDETVDQLDLEHLRWIAQQLHGDGVVANVQGCALIGFHLVQQPQKRLRLLQAVCSGLLGGATESSSMASCPRPTLAILSTNSTRQILQTLSLASTAINASRALRMVIGTNLPTLWARSKQAFLVDFDDWKPSQQGALSEQERQLDENGCFALTPPTNKSVDQHAWFRDTNPMMPNCACLTCQTHSRAYLYHLVCANELLGEMLLFIHNLHHLLSLIRTVNHYLKAEIDSVSDLCNHVEQQFAAIDNDTNAQ